MARPNLYDVEKDPILESISREYTNKNLIADFVFPFIDGVESTGSIAQYGEEDLVLKSEEDVRPRRPGAEAEEEDYSITWDTFATQEYARKKKIPLKVAEASPKPLRPYEDATRKLTNKLLLMREKRVISAITNETTFASYLTTIEAYAESSNEIYCYFDDYTNSNVPLVISKIKKIILQNCLEMPNIIVIPPHIESTMANHPKVLDLIKHTSRPDPDQLGDFFMGMKVLHANATSKSTDAGSKSFLMGNYIFMAYVDPSPGLDSVTLGATPRFKKFEVDQWFEKRYKSDYVEVSHDLCEKVMAAPCGYLIKNPVETNS